MKNKRAKKSSKDYGLFDDALGAIFDISKTSIPKTTVKLSNKSISGRVPAEVVVHNNLKPAYPKRTLFVKVIDKNISNMLVDMLPKNLFLDYEKFFSKDYDICVYASFYSKWMKYKVIPKLPTSYVSKHVGKKVIMETHYRFFSDSAKEYVPKYVTYDGQNVYPASHNMKYLRSIRKETIEKENLSFIAVLSLFDSIADLWTSEISIGGKSIIIPSDQEAMRELALLREGPTRTDNARKAILHWVKKHTRRTPKRVVDVTSHVRGVDRYEIGEFQVAVAPPMLSMMDLGNVDRFAGTLPYDMLQCVSENNTMEARIMNAKKLMTV